MPSRTATVLVTVLLSLFVVRSLGAADREYALKGMVISVDPAGKRFGVRTVIVLPKDSPAV